MNYDQFELFMRFYEDCLSTDILSLRYVIQQIYRNIIQNTSYHLLSSIFKLQQQWQTEYKQYCNDMLAMGCPETFAEFILSRYHPKNFII